MSSNGRLAICTGGTRVCIFDIESETKVTELIRSCQCAMSSLCSATMSYKGLVITGFANLYKSSDHGALPILWHESTKACIHTYYRSIINDCSPYSIQLSPQLSNMMLQDIIYVSFLNINSIISMCV